MKPKPQTLKITIETTASLDLVIDVLRRSLVAWDWNLTIDKNQITGTWSK